MNSIVATYALGDFRQESLDKALLSYAGFYAVNMGADQWVSEVSLTLT